MHVDLLLLHEDDSVSENVLEHELTHTHEAMSRCADTQHSLHDVVMLDSWVEELTLRCYWLIRFWTAGGRSGHVWSQAVTGGDCQKRN